MQNNARETPRLSVVMATYNREKTLPLAVESILAQSFGDFEFIIVDDGSADSTSDILAQYALWDSRIRVVRNSENLYIARSVNKGIAMARAPYIARMDDDDISLPERFSLQYQHLTKNPDIDVCGGAIFVMGDEYISRHPLHNEQIRAATLFQSSMNNPTTIVRKALLDKIGGYPNVILEDYVLWMQFCLQRNVVFGNIHNVVLNYTINNIHAGNRTEEAVISYQGELLTALLDEPPSPADIHCHTLMRYLGYANGKELLTTLDEAQCAALGDWCRKLYARNLKIQLIEPDTLREQMRVRFSDVDAYLNAELSRSPSTPHIQMLLPCAPIGYICFNRAHTVELSLQALGAAELAQQSDLHIFIDAPRNEQDAAGIEAVKQICCNEAITCKFSSVTYHIQEHNIGACSSNRYAAMTMASLSESFIMLEDDVVFSPYALRYFNAALEKYAPCSSVFSISGWRPPAMRIADDYPWDAWFCPRSHIWGWASWRSRMETVDWSAAAHLEMEAHPQLINAFNAGGPDMAAMLSSTVRSAQVGWDIVMDFNRFMQGKVSLAPVHPYTLNIGMETSSVGSANVNIAGQDISKAVLNPRLPDFIALDQDMIQKHYDSIVQTLTQ